MSHLGNIYFYVIVLIIIICLLAITITNTIYFTDIHNSDISNISSSQSQQLIFLNMLVSILLFISIIFIGYMISRDYEKGKNIKVIEKELNAKKYEFESMIDDIDKIRDEKIKKEMTRKAMKDILKELDDPKKMTEAQNKKLHMHLDKLKAKIKIMEDESNNLIKANAELRNKLNDNKQTISNLSEVNLDLQREIEEQINNNQSILSENVPEVKFIPDIIFDEPKSDLISNIFPNDASVTEVLKEIPRTSIIEPIEDEPTYDYEIPVNRDIVPKYESYDSKKDNNVISDYKPFKTSFLNLLNKK